MNALPPEIRAYYDRGKEVDRLAGGFPSGPLELARTQELILRHIADGALDVVDVGGGPGVYAEWMQRLGHTVQLVDPVPLHVAQARERGIDALVGDARHLDRPSASVDVVLQLGPLYHLVEKADRIQALAEARRVLRPGGWLFAAAISRFAALFDLLVRLDRLHEDAEFGVIADAVATGTFRGAQNEMFTTAYFHLPTELCDEAAEAGFTRAQLFNVEGPGFVVHDFAERWADPARREALLRAARLIEQQPETIGASSHLLLVDQA